MEYSKQEFPAKTDRASNDTAATLAYCSHPQLGANHPRRTGYPIRLRRLIRVVPRSPDSSNQCRSCPDREEANCQRGPNDSLSWVRSCGLR